MTLTKILALLALFMASNSVASEITTTQLLDKATGLTATVVTVPTELNNDFGILDVPSKVSKDNILKHWTPSQHPLMFNGGYFNHDFSPTGLCKIDGKTISKMKSKNLSGYLAIDKRGSVSILTRKDDIAEYPTVLQAGPYVIDPGGKIGIKSRSGNRAKRTLIGLTKEGSIVIIVTDPIFLFDLAQAINKNLPSIERLLNLDGGPSTALMAESHKVVNMWPVRNYIFKTRQ